MGDDEHMRGVPLQVCQHSDAEAPCANTYVMCSSDAHMVHTKKEDAEMNGEEKKEEEKKEEEEPDF